MSGYVIHEREVEPSRSDGDTASVRLMIGRDSGSERLEQRIIRFAAGRSQTRGPDEGRQEILYVAAGAGSLLVQGSVQEVAAGTGIFVAAGDRWKIENRRTEELVVVSVTAPQHAAPDVGRKITVSFDDQPELRADAQRTFRYLINQDAGCLDATQFVGLVQPFRAPDHSHHYDEVGYIIEGTGIAHIGDRRTLLEPGSCFHLPPELVHCIENNGDAVMRIMGVFHPSGDPASRAYDAAHAAS